ncbi:MAG: DUF805 domain-containing protein [Firmicutes bacterium]|nr:DUF805 domain-containing protein [Bacillota bacterium]
MADLIDQYFKMIRNFNYYKGTVSVRYYWQSFLSIFIVGFILFVFCEFGTLIIFLINLTTRIKIPLDTMNYLYPIFIAISLVGFLPLTVRRLRDASHSSLYLLWLFVPVVGWVFLVLALLEASVES